MRQSRRRPRVRGMTTAVIPAKAGIQYAAAFRFYRNCSGILDHPPSRVMTRGGCSHRIQFSNSPPGMDTASRSRRAIRASFASTSRLPNIRGRRECRALDAPAALCAKIKVAHKHSHHGHTGFTRHSPRNGFNAYIALSPVTGLVCHRRLAEDLPRNLTPASGRQDHTTSPSAGRCRSSPTSPASIASRTQRRDDAQRPSWWARDRWNLSLICA